ncbi:RING-type domain-containing protein [Forsythia ovata]|uniref:RING-type domain-containing protein n=1 Tax=Forsythia ovata TaxID=205694 RepID=A0ABD1VJZ4_9LAMI
MGNQAFESCPIGLGLHNAPTQSKLRRTSTQNNGDINEVADQDFMSLSSSMTPLPETRIPIGAAEVRVHFSCLEITMVGAQSTPPGENNNQYPYAKFSPSMAIIVVVLIAALFFVGFFSIYIRHCSNTSCTVGSVRRALSL